MTIQTCDVAACVARYAARLHTVIGGRHHVASPLGAWLLLALAGPASSGADRQRLAEIIGCDVESAARAAAELLAHPHPLVASAAAVWTRGAQDLSDHFRDWRAGLPPEVTFGALPDQPGLDAWARENTFGLIERFPIEVDPETYLVLASALATKVSWQAPFDLAAATELGLDSEWAHQLSQVLRTPDPGRGGHRQFIAVTDQAGDVAVHAATAQDGLVVYSVAAAQSVPPGQVLAAAYQIACADAVQAPVRVRHLTDLPLGEGPAWFLRQERAPQTAHDICTAVLPAWSARSEHDLKDPTLGFRQVRTALTQSDDPFAAKQAAMARYSRTGFEAAAVTATAMTASLVLTQSMRRVANLQFGHPYAVVAVTLQPGAGDAPWHGVPVFSAWVVAPEDAGRDDEQPAPPRMT
jgi:hypothetical protein